MAISFVAQTETDVTVANTTNTSAASSTAGNALILLVSIAAGATSKLSTVTDSAGNSWVVPSTNANVTPPANFVSGSNTYFAMAYVLNAAAITSLTVTISASKAFSYNLVEFSGVATASAVDQSNSVSNSTSTSPLLTPSITTTNANDLIIGGMSANNNSMTLGSAGYTALTNMVPIGTMKTVGAYQIVSATGTYSISWTPGASAVSGAGIMAFKAAAVAPPTVMGGTLSMMGVG